jgi:hypothetical protein
MICIEFHLHFLKKIINLVIFRTSSSRLIKKNFIYTSYGLCDIASRSYAQGKQTLFFSIFTISLRLLTSQNKLNPLWIYLVNNSNNSSNLKKKRNGRNQNIVFSFSQNDLHNLEDRRHSNQFSLGSIKFVLLSTKTKHSFL